MAKLTIEIDMDDPQEIWDALYRRIEEFIEDTLSEKILLSEVRNGDKTRITLVEGEVKLEVVAPHELASQND